LPGSVGKCKVEEEKKEKAKKKYKKKVHPLETLDPRIKLSFGSRPGIHDIDVDNSDSSGF